MTAEHIQRDAIRAIDDMPVLFTWSGYEYTGTRGALVTRAKLAEGGMFTEPDLSISTCLKKLVGNSLVDRFPNHSKPLPEEKLLNVGRTPGNNFHIETVTEDEFGALIQFDLVSAGNVPPTLANAGVIGGRLYGEGSPEGVEYARPGVTYIDTLTGDFWNKVTGNGNTGWVLQITA